MLFRDPDGNLINFFAPIRRMATRQRSTCTSLQSKTQEKRGKKFNEQ